MKGVYIYNNGRKKRKHMVCHVIYLSHRYWIRMLQPYQVAPLLVMYCRKRWLACHLWYREIETEQHSDARTYP
ncbi:hypothetical protein SORBI_3009G162550 [Sorghum bicolor]|uniref:Uncharacterized protein n=1 Tax=Sorghum bicolor TaxID=4558 RepID=A0A1Z5R2Y0_SORBI|nr:hypothetical protein SORBI_3009G162550 [Sorghum bicolor]